MNRTVLFAALFALSATAHAVDGEIVITHAKALAGNVTPGDAPGYPVTLSLPGKYKLGGNLVQSDPNTKVIEATSANINLDLNGFTVSGTNSCDYSNGVICAQSSTLVNAIDLRHENSHVGNGSITNVSGTAVKINGGAENLIIKETGEHGIEVVGGDAGLIRNNAISYTRVWGIVSNAYAGLISGNSLRSVNGGILVAGRSLVTGNSVMSNVAALQCDLGSAYNNNLLDSASANSVTGACTDTGGNLTF